MVRALPFRPDSRIDFGRVAAIAAAIAVHAAALLMLLMPMAAPPIAVVAKPKPVIRWIEKVEPKPIEVVPVAQPQPVQPTSPTVARMKPTTAPTIIDTPVIVDGGSEPVTAVSIEPTGDITGPVAPTGPMASATLEYVRATAPRYPIEAIRDRAEGTVMLRVLVDTDGKPIEVSIEKSSGNRALDKEARQHVLKSWRFKPALRDGVPVQAFGLVPIDFTLQ